MDAIQGTLDGIQYNIWAMKHEGYTLKMMVMGGKLVADDLCRATIHTWMEGRVEIVKEFVYALPFDCHFWYCHAVDGHNNLHHSLPGRIDG